MHSREADILQIKKYLKGELDAKEMHQLEKMAQHDPFLMDALEGYESAGRDQQGNLDELNRRVGERASQRKAAIVPLRYIGIAASVILICSAGVFWFYRQRQNPPVQPVASTRQQPVKTVQKPAPQPTRLAANEPPAASAQNIAQAGRRKIETAPVRRHQHNVANTVPVFAAVSPSDEQAKEDTATPATEMIAMEYGSEKKADTSRQLLAAKTTKMAAYGAPVKQIQGKAAGVSIDESGNTTSREKLINLGYTSEAAIQQATKRHTLQGRVIGSDDKQPIPGASVKIAGTNTGAITDANGYFRLNADSGLRHLEVGSIGYQTRLVSANVPDTQKTITLQPNTSSLAEVVVTNYNTQPKTDGAAETAPLSAKPVVGWRSYHKYLQINAVSPDHKKGVVKLSFMVDRYGSISQIKIVKSVSAQTDQKAIDMLHAGPGWMGNSDNKPQKVTLRIRFPGVEKN